LAAVNKMMCAIKASSKRSNFEEGNRRAGSPVNKNHKLAAGVTFVPALGVTSRCQRS
jgi:hypothetical protein